MKVNVAVCDSTIAESILPLAKRSASTDDTQPGALRGVVTLTLETRQAQRLVTGRPAVAGRPGIIGLFGFASLLRPIWQAALADDPYAEWWLVKIHEALQAADDSLKASIANVEANLAASEAIRVTPSTSVRPVQTPLRFSNPYAYRGAYRVAAFDRLVRAVLTARHVGILSRRAAERELSLAGRSLRRAFLSPVGYRVTGVTRCDVRQRTAQHALVQEKLGELPKAILDGTLRAPDLPRPAVPTAVDIDREGFASRLQGTPMDSGIATTKVPV